MNIINYKRAYETARPKLRHLYWMLSRQSKLAMENKLLTYDTIVKPVRGADSWNRDNSGRFKDKI